MDQETLNNKASLLGVTLHWLLETQAAQKNVVRLANSVQGHLSTVQAAAYDRSSSSVRLVRFTIGCYVYTRN